MWYISPVRDTHTFTHTHTHTHTDTHTHSHTHTQPHTHTATPTPTHTHLRTWRGYWCVYNKVMECLCGEIKPSTALLTSSHAHTRTHTHTHTHTYTHTHTRTHTHTNKHKDLLDPHSLFYYVSTVNPFLPTGQFFVPKLIILIQCLIDISIFKVLF